MSYASLRKNTFREIRSSIGRYLSILLIVMLGVGFYAGLTVCEETMVACVGDYLTEHGLFDFEIYSTWGFTEDELTALSECSALSAAEGAYAADALAEVTDGNGTPESLALHIQSLTQQLNTLDLTAGRLPENEHECVADAMLFTEEDIGSTVTLTDGGDADGLLAADSWTITGIARSPEYLNSERGTTQIGTGKLDACLWVSAACFDSEYYTVIYAAADFSGTEDADNTALTEGEQDSMADSLRDMEEGDETDETPLSEEDVDGVTDSLQDDVGEAEITPFTESYRAAIRARKAAVKAAAEDAIKPRWEETEEAYTYAPMTSMLSALAGQMKEGSLPSASASSGAAGGLDLPRDGELTAPEITVLTRSENTGCASFENDSKIISAIAQVFPVFFFLVAALVCATTMTRMIAEQRTQIGTLRSLGYGRGAICGKYLLYAGSAGLIGAAAGFAAGTKLLPYAIWTGYGTVYFFPDVLTYCFDGRVLLISLTAAMLCTAAVTLYALADTLREAPASLLRPKAPRAGKKTVVEYVGVLWNRLTFLQKVSLRNVLRYRARSVMMIIGISGCTALLLTGFGIRSSFLGLGTVQYEEISLYDAQVVFPDGLSAEEVEAYAVRNAAVLTGALAIRSRSGDITAGEKQKETTFVSVNAAAGEGTVGTEAAGEGAIGTEAAGEETIGTEAAGEESVGEYLCLTTADGESLALPGEGEILLDEGLARSLGVAAGDSVTVSENGRSADLTVSGVYRNRLGNCAYVSEETIRAVWGSSAVEFNGAYVLFRETEKATESTAGTESAESTEGTENTESTESTEKDSDAAQEGSSATDTAAAGGNTTETTVPSDEHEIAAQLLADSETAGVVLSLDNAQRYETSMQGLNFIILVVLLCAAALAFIVIYNLTNINLTERLREIATVKVLGFTDRETVRYVFRDNAILSVLGALLGLLLGKALHSFIISQLPLDSIVLSYEIEPVFYVISFAVTLLLSALMQRLMRHRIREIAMVESLKSVE